MKAAREQSTHTQSTLAAVLTVQQSAISAWERGDYEPARERWGEIAEALGVPYDDLFLISALDEPVLPAVAEEKDSAAE